ncbi:hypothetical protein A9F13_01g04345 [Clavispora lusitaniae]|uniref:Uncharacterized protein n=1 Tax=Clavispora lusitaniae TaxID=36911 RepID=A0AA91Q429_CLALS|nr:hypothetical protein E0198_003336 [Clavispora lusitaniae]OVF10990.1 hypothetical protein A9F13_01g04345 [Clavispora lusitaniae]
MDLSNLSNNLPPVKSLEQVSLVDLNRDLTNEFKNTAKAVASLYNATSQAECEHRSAKTEFSNAAKAVASLYRTGSNSNVLSMHKGYLDCLDDMLRVITNDEDIESWVLTRRAELTNSYNTNQNHGAGSPGRASVSHNTHERLTDEAFPVRTNKDSSHRLRDFDEASSENSKKNTTEKKFSNNGSANDLSSSQLHTDYEFSLPQELMSHVVFRPSFPPLSVSFKRSKKWCDIKDRKMPISLQDASGSSDCDSDDGITDADIKKKRLAHSLHEVPKRQKRAPGSDND